MIQQYHPRFSRSVVFSLLVIILLTPLWGFISTWGGTAIGPLWLWKSLLDIAIGVLAIVVVGWSLIDWSRSKEIVRRPIVVAVLLYTLFSLLATMIFTQANTQQIAAGLAFGLRYIAVFLIGYVTISLNPLFFWRAWAIKWLGAMALGLGIIGILQVAVIPADFLTQFGYKKGETISPVMVIDENPDAKRAFATTRGPNDYAAWLLIPLGLSLTPIWGKRLRYSIEAVTLLGIILSGSRSAWIAAALMIGVHVWRQYRVLIWQKPRYRLMALGTILLAGIGLVAAMNVPAVRLAIFHSSPTDSHLTEGSTDQHYLATEAGIRRIAANPVGCGLGCAGPGSMYGPEPKISENHYVQIAEEIGVVGLVAWCGMFGVIWLALYKITKRSRLAYGLTLSGIGLVAIGMLLHVWADIAVSVTYWGLAGLLLGFYDSRRSKNTVS